MFKYFFTVFCCISFLFQNQSNAQIVQYSEPDKEDSRTVEYEVLGKINNHYLVYKNSLNNHSISVLNNDLQLVQKTPLDFLPDRVASIDFIQYPGCFYMFYQYQKKNVFYAMVVRIGENGRNLEEPFELDTTTVSASTTGRIYNFLFSENKEHIMLVKVNTKSERVHYLTTVLFDKGLQFVSKTQMAINMPIRSSYLTEFAVDNEGDLFCLRASGSIQNDNIGKLFLLRKPNSDNNIELLDMGIGSIFLDDVHIKIDNFNKRVLVASLYSKQKRGNIDGMYIYYYCKNSHQQEVNTVINFSDELRDEAKGENAIKSAFNDYFVKNVVMKKNGGFLLTAECAYTSNRGGNINRWDYFGNPFFPGNTFNNYYGFNAPFGYGYYPWRNNSFNNITRYFADNIIMFSVNAAGKLEWANVINKNQYDDNSDKYIGFGTMNSGSQIHFLFNVQERRQQILTNQSIDPNGQITRYPPFKNLDRGYEFMPRTAKQTGLKQIIIPCMFRSYLCFAKIDFE